MLSSISFVYTHYYELSTTVGGVLISVPPLTGLLASLLVARIAAKTSPARLVAAGMVAGVVPPAFLLLSAGLPGCVDCLYARPRWYMTTIPCALISGVGFFALPAMQARSRPDLGQISARSRPDLGQISAISSRCCRRCSLFARSPHRPHSPSPVAPARGRCSSCRTFAT